MSRADLIWRGALVAVGAVLVLAGVAGPGPGIVCVVGALAAGERLARGREHGALESLVGLVGGALVLLVLLGLVLGSTPLRLSPESWALGLAVVSSAMLVLASRAPRPVRSSAGGPLGGLLRTAPWVLASIAVAAIAVSISVKSLERTDQAPLQMSLGSAKGVEVPITIRTSSRTGPLELRTTRGQDEVSYPLFTVPAGRSVTRTVVLPLHGRYLITLNQPDQTQPIRSLTIDR